MNKLVKIHEDSLDEINDSKLTFYSLRVLSTNDTDVNLRRNRNGEKIDFRCS